MAYIDEIDLQQKDIQIIWNIENYIDIVKYLWLYFRAHLGKTIFMEPWVCDDIARRLLL